MGTNSSGNRDAAATELSKERQASRPTEPRLKQLMIQGTRGDAKAYNALLRAVTPMLTSFYARRMRESEADVDDVVQETLIAVHKRRESFDESRPFTPWLFAIARHKLVDHFRRHRVHRPIDELEEILSAEGFEEASNARLDIRRLLDRLPSKQAQSIRQTRLKGLSIAEAAGLLGIGESDVKVSVHRGMKSLTARLALDAA